MGQTDAQFKTSQYQCRQLKDKAKHLSLETHHNQLHPRDPPLHQHI